MEARAEFCFAVLGSLRAHPIMFSLYTWIICNGFKALADLIQMVLWHT